MATGAMPDHVTATMRGWPLSHVQLNPAQIPYSQMKPIGFDAAAFAVDAQSAKLAFVPLCV